MNITAMIAGLAVAGVLVYTVKKLESTYAKLRNERQRRIASESRSSIRRRDHIRSLERLLSCAAGEEAKGQDYAARLESVVNAATDELDRLHRQESTKTN
ncbi:hypothetical protein KYT24_004385 [Salmonella enterica]|nr:hypothetical protein [Salmonella enterica]